MSIHKWELIEIKIETILSTEIKDQIPISKIIRDYPKSQP